LDERGDEMHWAFTQQLAEGRIDQWQREADNERLARVAMQPKADEIAPRMKLRIRAYRRALAAVALSMFVLLGLTSVAMAYPTDAGPNSDAGAKGPSAIELCLRKQSPDGGMCRDAATGAVGPIAPAETVESPAVRGRVGFDAGLVALVVGLMIIVGAGAAAAGTRRHATV
jgi:hypothetical protein